MKGENIEVWRHMTWSLPSPMGMWQLLRTPFFLSNVTYFMNSPLDEIQECNSQDWDLYAKNNGMGNTKKAMTMYSEAEGDWVIGKQYYRA